MQRRGRRESQSGAEVGKDKNIFFTRSFLLCFPFPDGGTQEREIPLSPAVKGASGSPVGDSAPELRLS